MLGGCECDYSLALGHRLVGLKVLASRSVVDTYYSPTPHFSFYKMSTEK